MSKVFKSLHARGITGEGLASVLFVILLIITWPVYLWSSEKWLILGPSTLFWLSSTMYFALEIWVLMFVAKEFTQYPFMSLDALLGGGLFAAGAALRRMNGHSSALLFAGAASWMIVVCSAILLMRVYALASRCSLRAK